MTERILMLLSLLLLFGCSNGRIAEEDCQSICGGEARLELVQHECGRLSDDVSGNEDVATCRLAAAAAFEACHSRCE